jgi:hypothetical protein
LWLGVILLRTLALSEFLAGAANVDFDLRAAAEAAQWHRESVRNKDKREGAESWPKVKFDRQIVAIAAVEGASAIYSNDRDVKRLGERSGLPVFAMDDLPAPF